MKSRAIISGLLGIGLGASAIQSLHALTTLPAYVVTEIGIADAEAFREYAPQVQTSFAPYGGRYLVRGGAAQSFAGETPKRVVMLAFDNMERARAWYDSPVYEALKSLYGPTVRCKTEFQD